MGTFGDQSYSSIGAPDRADSCERIALNCNFVGVYRNKISSVEFQILIISMSQFMMYNQLIGVP